MPRLSQRAETWPIRGRFRISRGARTEVQVVLVELTEGAPRGRGECVPYARYGESVEGVQNQLEEIAPALADGLNREELQERLPAGAARNALDCALWDLAAKQSGQRVWQLAGLPEPQPEITAYTLSLDSAEAMGRAAAAAADRALLKIKLDGEDVIPRMAAIRAGAPKARLVVDANEAWSAELYGAVAPDLARLGVEMIEQPLPAGQDQALAGMARPVKLCADESVHDRATLAGLTDRYDMINIKLDKTGGLTEALALRQAAEALGLEIMVGCMLATSLAMAPAVLVAQGAAVVDLDGPLLLAEDRPEALTFAASRIHPPEPELWG